jgi:hypothetical protein
MAITYAEICDAIADYLDATCPVLRRIQSYDEMTEGMQDWPTIQVYPEALETVAADSGTQWNTFGGALIQETHIIHVDFYARQRSHIGEDMAALVEGIDEICDALEPAGGCPPFELEGIKNYQWSWSRVVFEYASVMYMGARFVIRVRTF